MEVYFCARSFKRFSSLSTVTVAPCLHWVDVQGRTVNGFINGLFWESTCGLNSALSDRSAMCEVELLQQVHSLSECQVAESVLSPVA
ncbi:hypothetical protein M413DRAFT_344643 [Hebeloma cylindrosporum]|uniref:Uncharacterized protein n=1 Tax=Hebeloma cylindrosporum TaxID=76867 RepID=A0A0C2Y725_HEBCY|nr:hypothetical protein M413DRAFT_344643 [Hebeloma cylindrosporum h7]